MLACVGTVSDSLFIVFFCLTEYQSIWAGAAGGHSVWNSAPLLPSKWKTPESVTLFSPTLSPDHVWTRFYLWKHLPTCALTRPCQQEPCSSAINQPDHCVSCKTSLFRAHYCSWMTDSRPHTIDSHQSTFTPSARPRGGIG